MPAPLTIDVALTPALLPPPSLPDATVYVVIDVVRATTTLCALFERGAHRTLIAPGIAEARLARATLGNSYLLAGEVHGARPNGFDLGNSPSEFAALDMHGRDLIFATTNGTRALRACRNGHAIFAGAFRNASAVALAALVAVPNAESPTSNTATPSANTAFEAMMPDCPAQIIFVCSGRGEHPAFDDTLCAGYLLSALCDAARAQGRDCALDGGAPIALSVWRDVERSSNLRDALASSGAGKAITSIGLASDLDWCAAIDATEIVPTLTSSLSADGIDLLTIEPQR